MRFRRSGRDGEGEIYAADFGPGAVYRLVARQTSPPTNGRSQWPDEHSFVIGACFLR
jgi:hypothetical protein